jgi:uncharacterized membrane protein HdeD (DUF308 family)
MDRSRSRTLTAADRPGTAGQDATDVQIHTDAPAEQAAQLLGARAFAAGRDIFFGPGSYQPRTPAGQHLLAHELAHALPVHQSMAARAEAPVHLAIELPEPVTEKTARAWFSGPGFYYWIRDDIQWHLNALFGAVFDLVVQAPEELRPRLTAQDIATAGVQVLTSALQLPLRPGGQEGLVREVAQVIEAYDLTQGWAMRVPVGVGVAREYFEPTTYDVYLQELRKLGMALIAGPLIASGNFATRKGTPHAGTGGRTKPPTAWAEEKAKQINALIRQARTQPSPPKDLPDRVTAWHNDRDGSWYLNIWVYFGTTGATKAGHAIKLSADEPAERTLERARAATTTALQHAEDRAEAAAAPPWARALLGRLQQRLAQLHRAEPKATDFPDGLGLLLEGGVQLRVWVDRPAGESLERGTGSVPIAQRSTVEQLVPYVRRLAAVLREFESTTGAPPSGVEIMLDDPSKLALAAFPARLEPVDLRSDNITVTGAHNSFHMNLDFERIYGGGPDADLYIASKLYSQTIHFFWEVYAVPKDLPVPTGETAAPTDWQRRWVWLYDLFNPGESEPAKSEQGTAMANLRSKLGKPVTRRAGSELVSRVDIPQTPGEYLVRCITGHGAIGKNELKRLSSEAYYPVRVEPIKDVAEAAANQRSEALKLAEAELQSISALLAGHDIDENRRQMLLAQQYFRTGYLERLRRRERLSLAEGTAEELAYATETLEKVKELNRILPGVMAKAKAEKVGPSALLADKPDLFTLHWFIIAEHKTVEGYQEELAEQVKYLTGLKGRAKEFQKELRGDSRYQYSVTAAFVSEVTGQVYPLVFILGEAPESVRTAGARTGAAIIPEVAYTLVDVTSKQTQKVYHGVSYRSGPAGHREAIDNAFEDFGSDAVYGEGLIAVRIPPGVAGAQDPNHPGTATKFYRSEEGVLQKVLWALGIIAAVAGLAALAATGVGAPAAAAVLGLVAGVAGAVTSLHNISERSRRHTLEWDAEMVLDIIAIVSVIPAAVGTRIALAARAAGGFQQMTVAVRFVQIYGFTEMGATVVLIPTKLAQDIYRIEHDDSLTREQKNRLITEAKLGAAQGFLMLAGSAVASHAAGRRGGGQAPIDENNPAVKRQLELLELEGLGEYDSMHNRGLVDEHGNLTDKGKGVAGIEPAKTAEPAETAKPAETKPPTETKPTTETKPATGAEPPQPATPPSAAKPPTQAELVVEQRKAAVTAIENEVTELRRQRDAAEAHRLAEKDDLVRQAIAKDAQASRLEQRAGSTSDPAKRATVEAQAKKARAEHEAVRQRQIDNQAEVDRINRDRAQAEERLNTAKENLKLAEAGRAISDTAAVADRLQSIVSEEAAKFDTGVTGMSPEQAKAAATGGPGVATQRGVVINNQVKARILAEAQLAGLMVTPEGTFGPDVYDPLTKRWWDVTTPEQWDAHVKKYGDQFGQGIPLFTRPPNPK